jgi:hypothetical protein
MSGLSAAGSRAALENECRKLIEAEKGKNKIGLDMFVRLKSPPRLLKTSIAYKHTFGPQNLSEQKIEAKNAIF